MAKKATAGAEAAETPEVMDPAKMAGASVGEEMAMQLASGASIVMMANEKMFGLAVQYPRDEDKVLKDLLACVKRSALFADDAIYSKPVGKSFNEATGKYDGPMKYAEGLSIRAMEEARRLYGNNEVLLYFTEDTADHVDLMVVFIDYERKTRFVVPKRISKFQKTRDGKIVAIAPDRFADLSIPKAISVAFRDAVSRSIPSWMKAELEAACRAKRSKVRPEVRRKKIVDAFNRLDPPIPLSALETYIGKPMGDWKHGDMNQLQGVGVALKDGELTSEEAFGIKKPAPPKTAEAEAGKKPEESNLKPAGGLFDNAGGAPPDGGTAGNPPPEREPGQEG